MPGSAHEDPLVEALSGFARALARTSALEEVLRELCVRVVAALDLGGAGVSWARDGRLHALAAPDEPTARLERLQEDQQAGPGVEAFRSGEPFLVASADEVVARWPALARRARAEGVVAMAGIPVGVDGARLGVLDLYDRSMRVWSAHDVGVAGVLADVAGAHAVAVTELERERRTVEQLQQALGSRVVIEQAKGVIAAERKIPVEQAFELLRAHARRHNADVHSVAEAVVHLGLRP